MPEKKFTPLTRKINTLILISLFSGVGATILYFSYRIIGSMNDSIETNLKQQADILSLAIENYMIPGEAGQAVEFFQDLKNNSNLIIKLYRANKTIAFSDAETIIAVNSNRTGKTFDVTERITDTEPPLRENPRLVSYFETAQRPNPAPGLGAFKLKDSTNRQYYRAYIPLMNLPKCTYCHGHGHTIRGVIDIRSDITGISMEQTRVPLISAGILMGVVIGLAGLLSLFLRRTIINPVRSIGEVCLNVTEGDFDAAVSIRNNDEIGILGKTVNRMVAGLYERYELSKYVSSSTVRSLGHEEQGQKESLTMFFSDIRSFTSYSETHPPETVVNYLNKILSLQTDIIRENGGDIDKYVGDAIVATFAGENQEIDACRAAILIQQSLAKDTGGEYDGLKVGIGIHRGEVIQGMIGSRKRADFTIIGDNVNVTARLCSAAKPGQIIISADLYKPLSPRVKVKGPYKIKVKGKEKDLVVFLLHGLKGTAHA